MFFKSQKQLKEPEAIPPKISSFLTKNSEFKGDITTDDNIEINGKFIGNIICKKELKVSEFGSIVGEIKANRVINSGKIDGDIECDLFIGDRTSSTKYKLKSNSVEISGKFDGTLECTTLFIDQSGDIKKTIQAQDIKVDGKVNGDIACKKLSTTTHADIKGKLFVNQLINQGGSIDGFIEKFQNIIVQEEHLSKDDVLKKSREKTEDKEIAIVQQ